jgi:hypothetical protein
MIFETWRSSWTTPYSRRWPESAASSRNPAMAVGEMEEIERDRGYLRGRWSNRVQAWFPRLFYRLRRGYYCHFTAGDGRDVAAV